MQVVTYNVSAWSSAKAFLENTGAHVVCLQETHLLDDAAADVWMRQRGWTALWARALPGATSTSSRGDVAVAVRSRVGFGISAFPGWPGGLLVEGRAVIAKVDVPGGTQLAVVSAYLISGQGLSPENLQIMGTIGDALADTELPFFVRADFQMPPEVVASTPWIADLGAQVASDLELGTCKDSRGHMNTLDWFVVSSSLAKVVAEIAVDTSVEAHPHRPVSLHFHTLGKEAMYVTVAKPERIPHEQNCRAAPAAARLEGGGRHVWGSACAASFS